MFGKATQEIARLIIEFIEKSFEEWVKEKEIDQKEVMVAMKFKNYVVLSLDKIVKNDKKKETLS